MPAYVKALCREIDAARERWGRLSISTIYLGGGTPSLLPLDLVSELFDAVDAAFHIAADPEITIEANPETVTSDYLHGLRAVGVNRLSLGVQSTYDADLQMLGRTHTWADATEAIQSARAAGLDNVSLEILFGLPSQTVSQWKRTLRTALGLEPHHLSLSGLTLEEGTLLAQQVAGGVLPQPDEKRSAVMYEVAEDLLAQKGFFHYEITSWARSDDLGPDKHARSAWWPGSGGAEPRATERISPCVCAHNLKYWRNQPWLGVGAGAHSWFDGLRPANVKDPEAYIAAWGAAGQSPAIYGPTGRGTVEVIPRSLEMGETMMLGLRLAEGVSSRRFESRFGEPLADIYGTELNHLHQLGLVKWDGSIVRLTRRGRLLANRVFVRFL